MSRVGVSDGCQCRIGTEFFDLLAARPRASKSFSSPSTTTTAGLNPPPRPPRRGAAPPAPRRAPPPAPRPSSPSDKLVDLPPRSDSRNACAPVKLVSSRPLRPLSPPSVVETAPLSIHHRPTPFAPPPVPAPTTPFRAVVVQRPSTHAVHTQNPGSLLVTINAGGSTYTTCLETLTSQGRAGKLGEFAEAVVEEVKRAPPPAATKRDTVARASSLYPSSDDGESILNSSHFAVSPFSSPFPYAPYDDLQPSALDLDLGATEFLPSSPTSPIDPYAKKLFLPLPPPSFVPPPSALSPVKNNSQLVRTPSPHLRIKSFHPEIVPSPPSSGKTECERRASSLSDSGTVSDDEYNDCDAIALRSRLHLSSTTTEVNPFERALGPFFEVLHGQSQAASSDDHAMAVERESIGYPVDIGEDTAEDRSRSTMLGVPRGSLRVKGPRRMRTAEEMGPVPEVPRVFVDSQERRRSDGSRPPSLSHSLSTIDAEGDFASARTLHEPEPEFIIFLDRTPAQDVYSAILTFLRDDVLPPPFSLPRAPSNDQKRSSTTPDVDPSHLSILSLSPLSLIDLFSRLHLLCTEAKWFGMDALVARCEMERERLTEVVAWLEEEKERKAVKEERERRAVVMKGREKAGWI